MFLELLFLFQSMGYLFSQANEEVQADFQVALQPQ